MNILTISPHSPYEINNGFFEGWGTSFCWWANRLGYSDSLSEQAAEAMFGKSGLRMNIVRYNIGGGDDPTHNHITRTDSEIPGYTVYNDGVVTYDWTADANQRNMLFKTIEACEEELIVEMFSNSPPYYMTNSGCSCGNANPASDNLREDCYGDFAEYLATVCEHFEKEWGVNIQSISAMNEPYTDYWWQYSNKQEGCHFDIGDSQSEIILRLQSALQAKGLNDIILCGTDETSIDTQIQAYNELSKDAQNAISRIDTHTYGGSSRSELKALAISSGKNLWMSEVDGGNVAGTDAGEMGAALWLAQRISDDCNGLNPSAWILWQVIDSHICVEGFNGKTDKGMVDTSGGYWGLAVADHDNDRIIFTKKYYAFGQYSRYIRPGYTMLNSSDSTVTAYDSEYNRLVIVAINTSAEDVGTYFDLSQFDAIGKSVQVIRTSGSMEDGENWAELNPLPTSESGFSANLLANSITTYIIADVTVGKQ